MAELEAKQVTGTIPFFFYDLIGRIVPGTALIMGITLFCISPADLSLNLKELFPPDSTTGYSAVALIIFFGFAHVVGVLLGSMSFFIARLANRFRPLNYEVMFDYLGIKSIGLLKKRYEPFFGKFPEDEPRAIDRCSHQCIYYVWRVSPNLGLIASRADAELLAAQSLVLVNIVLWLLPIIHCLMPSCLKTYKDLYWFIAFTIAFWGTGASFAERDYLGDSDCF